MTVLQSARDRWLPGFRLLDPGCDLSIDAREDCLRLNGEIFLERHEVLDNLAASEIVRRAKVILKITSDAGAPYDNSFAAEHAPAFTPITVRREKGMTVYEASALDPKAKIAEDRAKEIERISRVLCATMDPGIDPDSMVAAQGRELQRTANGRIVIPHHSELYVLWRAYARAAEVIYEDRNASK